MPLNKLENFIKNTEGRILYVNPSDLDSTDAIENQGNSLTKPFKTIQRALLEAARFSWVKGNDNDIIEKTTILLYPGEHVVDNRPGFAIKSDGLVAKAVSPAGAITNALDTLTLNANSNFDLTQEDNILYKFNSIYGGAVVPRGTSLVGLDLRKTKVRPKYVPNPTDPTQKGSAIFRITGGCYFWQFTTFDGNEDGVVYTDSQDFTAANQAKPTFSHNKLTIFEYADGITTPSGYTLTDLDQYYSKLSNAFNIASGRDIDQKYPAIPGGFTSQRPEYEIVGAFGSDPVSITNIISGNGATPGTVVTVTTSIAHGLNRGTPIKIKGVSVDDYNISTIVTDVDVNNDKIFTYALPLVRANLPAAPSASGATVTIETDTVSGSSPYIFNCSLRSVWGMNGMLADGRKATGFRSVVAAQFTGVSLQKDDRAFVKYNPTSRTYDEITTTKVTGADLASGSSSTNKDTVYHLDSDAIYKNDWETIHIKSINDAVMQLVSIFAIGYTRHFDVRTGSDYSLTNSNSNFGQLSLVSSGFKKAAFTKDNKAYLTSIITPKAITSAEEDVDWQGFDVGVTTSVGITSHLYLYGYTDEDVKPPVLVQGYRVGAKVNDVIYIKDNQSTPVIHSASIQMVDSTASNVSYGAKSSVKDWAVTNVASNQFTLEGTGHGILTGEKVVLIANDGDLPENIEPHRVYYAIKVDATKIKLASSLTNANTNTAITVYYSGSSLKIQSRVTDKQSGDVGHPIQWDSSNNQWYLHTDAGNAIYTAFNTQGVVGFGTATTKPSYFKRVEDTRSLDEKLYKLRVVIPKEFDNSKNPEEGFIIQESSSTGFRNDTDSALAYSISNSAVIDGEDYEYNRNPSFISECSQADNQVTVLTEQPHGLNLYDQVIIKNVKSNVNTTGAGNSAYNGTFSISDIPDANTFKYSTTDVNDVIHTVGGDSTNDTTVRDSNLPRFERNDCQGNYYIYRNEVITPYTKDVQDGIYHLYVLNANNNVGVAFTNIGYSQSVSDLYPQQDKDNPNDNPGSSSTYASRSPLGEVSTSDQRHSLTRETADKFIKDLQIGNSITGIITSFTSGGVTGIATVTFDRRHNLSGIVTARIANGGSGYTNGTHQNVKLFNNGTSTWDGALAKVIVASGAVTHIEVTSGGAAYGAENLDVDLTTAGTPADIVIAASGSTASLSGISTVVGNTVQITGIGTTAGGHFRILSVPSTTQVSVAITNADASINVGQYLINIGHEIRVSNTSYSNSVETITTAQPHGLAAGNKVTLTNSDNSKIGDYLVRSSGLGTNTFTVSSSTDIPTSTYVLKNGLSANDKTSDSDGENLGARGLPLYGNERYTLVTAIGQLSTQVKIRLHGVDNSTVSRFELGSYVQIDSEIMRISHNKLSGAASDELFVIRGALGTQITPHTAGSLIRKITPRALEFRRPSIIRASGHTFEYIGYGPGNYSTGIPQVQVKTLTEKEDYLAQAQERDCGTVVYTGMNSKGDFIIGNKKINSATGQEKTFDIPVPTVTGQDPARLSVVFDEVVVKERLLVEGGNSGTILSEFDGPVNFSKNVKIGGTLTVTGSVKNTQPIEVTDSTDSYDKDSGCMILGGGLGVEKNVNIGKGARVGLGLTVGTLLDVNGNADVAGTLGVTGNTTLAGTLGVTGNATFAGNVLLGDSDKIILGANTDTEIYHDDANFSLKNNKGSITNYLPSSNSVGFYIQQQTSNNYYAKFETDASGFERVELLYNGLKKFETTVAGITVTGSATISSNLSVNGQISATGDIIAYSSSDKRLKDNITPIENPLAKVLSISGNTFNWNEASKWEGKADTGVIAQEVQELGLPGLTDIREDGTHAVRYEKLVPVLIEAIKELSAKVDALS